MRAPVMSTARVMVVAALVATVVAALVLAGCGSGAAHPAAPAAARTTPAAGGVRPSGPEAFSVCMRAHGVPQFPDLRDGGMQILGSGAALSVNGVRVGTPAFGAARARCQGYLPRHVAGTTSEIQARGQALRFARCLRGHGVPNFPDPRFIITGGQLAVYLGPDVNPQSPAFRAAVKACGGPPKG